MAQKLLKDFSTSDVIAWITHNVRGGKMKYKTIELIKEEDLNGSALLALNRDDFVELGIPPIMASRLFDTLKKEFPKQFANASDNNSDEILSASDIMDRLLAQHERKLADRDTDKNKNNKFRVALFVGNRRKLTHNYFTTKNTVLDLKREIAETELGGTLRGVLLVFNGKRLADDKTLGECGIVNSSCFVTTIIRLAGGPFAKVVVLMDATASMKDPLGSKISINDIISRISSILEENNMPPKSFQLQFVAYRNYNAPCEELLEYSGWSNDANELNKFISGIDSKHGWGNEAIEIGFNYINQLINKEKDNISQIILIGDAPPNTKKEVDEKRKKREEKYWQKTKFSQATYWEDELKNIVQHNVAVDAYYLKDQAKAVFSQIAQRTNGKCEKLDISSDKGAQALTDLVSKHVLRSYGCDNLVTSYEKKFASGSGSGSGSWLSMFSIW